MDKYLIETKSIDYYNSFIQEKVHELKSQSIDDIYYIKRGYDFVRDEIPHSWDIQADIVSKTASEVLRNKTGICWTKSCLLAALLRANQIPSVISYQLLTRADDASEGYMIHALNTVYIKDLKNGFALMPVETRKILMPNSVWAASNWLIRFEKNLANRL